MAVASVREDRREAVGDSGGKEIKLWEESRQRKTHY